MVLVYGVADEVNRQISSIPLSKLANIPIANFLNTPYP